VEERIFGREKDILMEKRIFGGEKDFWWRNIRAGLI